MMAEAKERAEWDRTAMLWHVMAEAHRDPRQQWVPYSPADIHPYRTEADYEPLPSNDLSEARAMFEAVKHNGIRSN